ncbi:bifunctional DNA-formamidopyrimidine glycosylase/DNA-(apurinic or apyrimidinic site) lyase [Dinoroseobacter sp. PD6]|uniref:bifunctional DNA-formamidopyrimidine glycosylase/DNA-(apurinic or apyrimidinic site) lyase n=1 Tax=Dinoroseobacter sp. PD6 TaxID=3028384 RepID=UPI00237A3BDF|nr:bifunctional DNA-formamidopyrimidine glycosylase/DNA-(apurinic or apyrimidinic site) lyase [Dinoroseobacter sp. PD6]MDD9718177.1 bifunctional DNA-formamidopyrimidine glycosylase/DNA-(apurinic or apyrimidinic site) lyase [Dinoroseobacter sp. PD6]
MPELPEVETVRRGLEPVMTGQRIIAADIRRPDLRWPLPANMQTRLEGKRILRLARRSKYILAELDSGETLIIHLGMSGRILIHGGQAPGAFHHALPALEKHDHVVLDFDTGARVVFNDARRFGAMDLCETTEIDQHPMLATLGPEPLGNAFHEAYLTTRLKGRMTPIKSALLDQKVVAGLGNIYVCEALFQAGISPLRKAARVSETRIASLVPIIRTVLGDAIEAGGSSLRDYRQTDGDLGYFQHRFRVYDRENAPCVTAGCPDVVRRVVQSGRSSFYCPSCQR